MTREQALSLRPGQVVTSSTWEGGTETVEGVNAKVFPDDPLVLFIGGGWWRSSRLTVVPEISESVAGEIVRAIASMVRGQSRVARGHRDFNAGVESAARIVEDCLPGLLERLGERPRSPASQTDGRVASEKESSRE